MSVPPGMEQDTRWMERALGLARASVGLASPNPHVGCVLVSPAGAMVGEGFHQYDQKFHAEVVALRQAGEQARGATAYVTLEPCSHHGRTGPCADALIAAGVRRVVVATLDPNPAVNGRGVYRLRDAGVEVLAGVLVEPARRLNDAFARSIQSLRPFVTLKVASSLDGRIAPAPMHREPGQPFWLTGEAARAEVQQLRHAHDAVLTGIQTVLDDDPLLTDRSGGPRRRPLLRVVLDSSLRLPLESKLLSAASNPDVLLFCAGDAGPRAHELRERGVRVEAIAGGAGALDLRAVLTRLGELQITSVLVEAGSKVNASMLAAGVVDKLVLFYAPAILGPEGMPMAEALEASRLPLGQMSARMIGNDCCLEGYLSDPWASAEPLAGRTN